MAINTFMQFLLAANTSKRQQHTAAANSRTLQHIAAGLLVLLGFFGVLCLLR